MLRTSAFASLTFRVAATDAVLALACPGERPAAGAAPAAVRIPRGAGVVMSPAQLGADAGLWSFAGEFRPERFLGGGSGDARDAFAFLPFGAARTPPLLRAQRLQAQNCRAERGRGGGRLRRARAAQGPHTCLGARLAMVQATSVVAAVVPSRAPPRPPLLYENA